MLGVEQSFTSYGGLIGGLNNTLSGEHASVFGASNTASGPESSVSGGEANTASGDIVGERRRGPHVAGVAAMLAGKGLTNVEIIDCIKVRSANPRTGQRGKYDPVYGWGIVDAYAATKDCRAA